MRNKHAIYTCVIGKENSIQEPHFLDENFDYICITDQSIPQGSIWKEILIESLLPNEYGELNTVQKVDFIKWNPHLFLSKYDTSVYFDSSLGITDSKIYNTINNIIESKADIALQKDSIYSCVYSAIIQQLGCEQDFFEQIEEFVQRLQRENYPVDSGFYDSCLVFRRHNSSDIIEINKKVWDISCGLSVDSRFVLPYVIYNSLNNIIIEGLPYNLDGITRVEQVCPIDMSQKNALQNVKQILKPFYKLTLKSAKLMLQLVYSLYKKKVNIVFICPEYHRVSFVLYVTSVLKELKKDQDFSNISYEILDEKSLFNIHKYKFDYIYNFKVRSAAAYEILKSYVDKNIPLIFECDDNFLQIYYQEQKNKLLFLPNKDSLTINMLKIASQVYVYSEQCYEDMSKYNKNTIVLPTYKNTHHGLPQTTPQKKVIGYMGSLKRDFDFVFIVPTIQKLLAKYEDLHFEFMGYIPHELKDHPRVNFLTWNTNYEDFIANLKSREWVIGLSPLQDHLFNRSKTNIKYKEYAALGIPGIYSNIPPYSNTIKNYQCGLLADNTPESWLDAIELLLSDKNLRAKIIQSAYDDIKESYSFDSYVRLKKEIFISMCKR